MWIHLKQDKGGEILDGLKVFLNIALCEVLKIEVASPWNHLYSNEVSTPFFFFPLLFMAQ